MRITKIIKKEYKQVLRDRAFLLILILEPLILMLVFGYTFQSDIKNLKTIIIDEDNTLYSTKIIQSAQESEYFNVLDKAMSFNESKEELKKGNLRAIIVIPPGFGKKLDGAEKASITIYIDSSDYTVYNILKAASGELLKDSIKDIVSLIVENLETEKDINKERIDEINVLMNQLKNEAEGTKNNLSALLDDFDSLELRLADMENSVSSLEKSISGLPIPQSVMSKIGEIKQNLKDARNEVDDRKTDVGSIRDDTRGLKEDYDSIEEKVKSIDFKLETLKRDFLSYPISIERNFEYGEISYFQYLAPAIISLILFFIGIVLTTMNFVEERNNMTLFRVFMTPVKKWQFYFGKFFVFALVGLLEAVYILLISVYLFDVNITGGILNVFIVLALLMFASVGLGLLISTFVKTMRQAILTGPLVVIPALLISQTFSPIEVMPEFMRYFAYLSPLYYSNIALREIMIKGAVLADVSFEILILAIYSFITLVLGILISKKRIN